MRRAQVRSCLLGACLVLAACDGSDPSPPAPPGPVDPPPGPAARCAPGAGPQEMTGSVASADAKSWRMLPFEVAPGTGRVEVAYEWSENAGLPGTPLTATTLDLGLWDERGYRNDAAFRGWGGSRQGRLDREQPPVFVEAGAADRGYVPGPVRPGTWTVDLGIAAVSPQGASWRVVVECRAAGGTLPAADPVDRNHVARREPGWYHGDFHMHGYHSNPSAPDDADFVAQARAGSLDFLMVTEYVTGRHWQTLGAMQRAHPDLLVWPGREVITYFGHANVHGETPELMEYRHGFEDVSLADIQRRAKAAGALFQVNHPTIFPPPLFSNFCRGCYFELGGVIDWAAVDTMELVSGPILATGDDLGVPLPQPQIENPFVTTAILLWEQQMRAGHRITGVSGSDSKGVDAAGERPRKGYGSSATAVYAPELSRAALAAAIQAGHAYIRTRGVAGSPGVAFEAFSTDGRQAMYGDVLPIAAGASVTLRTTVTGGAGQVLTYFANGLPMAAVPVLTDPFVHEQQASRQMLTEQGPLGTFWRIETRDLQSRTTIGNPIYLAPP